MIESLKLIQEVIEDVMVNMSINDPRYKNLIIANKECKILINNYKLYEIHYE